MVIADEEARAALYRLQQANRARAEVVRDRMLRGNPLAAAALRQRYQPLLDWIQERNQTDGRQETE